MREVVLLMMTTITTQNGVTSWNETQLDSYRAVMDAFQKYNNTAGFFIGNEVLNVCMSTVARRSVASV